MEIALNFKETAKEPLPEGIPILVIVKPNRYCKGGMTACTIQRFSFGQSLYGHLFGGYEYEYDFDIKDITHWCPIPDLKHLPAGLK